MITPLSLNHLITRFKPFYKVKKKCTNRMNKCYNKQLKDKRKMETDTNATVETEVKEAIIDNNPIDTRIEEIETKEEPKRNENQKDKLVENENTELAIEPIEEKKSSIQMQKDKVLEDERNRVLELLKTIDKQHIDTVIESIENGLSLEETKAKLFDKISAKQNDINRVLGNEAKVGVKPISTVHTDIKTKSEQLKELQQKNNLTAYHAQLLWNEMNKG